MSQWSVPMFDPNILLSWINMKLRDECKDIEQLCERYEVAKEEIFEKMNAIGFVYSKKQNQFIAETALK